MHSPIITSDVGVLATLCGICAGFYWLEKNTGWRVFIYLPALVFIYAVPAVLCNVGVLPAVSPVHDVLDSLALPVMLVLLLLEVDVVSTLRLMGRGVVVMLFGTLGVVVGAPIGMLLVRRWLEPDAWKAFGSLAGSWVGGSANLAAVNNMVQGEGAPKSLAILGDTTMYLVWLPILMSSKAFADRFANFTGVDHERMDELERSSIERGDVRRPPTHVDILYLLAIGFTVAWICNSAAAWVKINWRPDQAPTVRILLVTTIGIMLSATPLRRIPGARELAMALVMLYMAHMGATASLAGVASQAIPFLAGAFVWILIHGCFCLLGAKLARVDIHTAAIASAANIGGVATASQVALHHKEGLVPAGILMALMGYALGNYAGFAAAMLCKWAS
jgi:uncharacterized membrane protein